ncbi:ABC transporter substrate binding protein [Aliamphritea spongicola]|uniref:ABC transporter substrate binding protein n=1 Tax=Aliamphritea spongicola TaxID=707589 RepID=UPI00196ADE50|nr:ABC transporter substrate binding protein [Aliamphritea spongicola]MBN3562005.1 diguanylate cyclase [Aliamphritea spongicola]
MCWRRVSLIALYMVVSAQMLPFAFAADAVSSEAERVRVLYINSYHPGYEWSDGIQSGVQEVFAAADYDTDLTIEYLDALRFDQVRLQAAQVRLISAKYRDYQPDIILTSDNYAFDFMKEYRDVFFPGIPLVFSGYNNFSPDVLGDMHNVTGVNEEIDYRDGIMMALSVHPDIRTLAFVLSTDDVSNRRNYETAKPVLQELAGQYEVVELLDMTQAEIAERLKELPPESLVFMAGLTADQASGRHYSRIEHGQRVVSVSPFPVYSFWPFHLKSGAVGGRLITGEEQGRAMASIALRILDGEFPEDIPVMMTSPTKDIFNYDQLKRFQIDPERLPPGAMIQGMPETLWVKYSMWLIAGAIFVVLQTVLIMMLYRNIRARKKAIAALFHERSQLESRVSERTEALQKANMRLKKISMEDGLTGLANRRYLDQALGKEVVRRDRHAAELSLMLIDIDYFKQFNDIYGHLEGDACLQEVALALQETCVRDSDIVARFGGEEFVIVMPNTGYNGGQRVAEKVMQQMVNLNISHTGSDISDRLTVSVGMVTVPKDISMTQHAIIELADEQLYLAKGTGRNRICACLAGGNQVTA